MSSVRANVAANYVGRVWTTALGFLFIPVYLKYLGIEAYALVGFYTTLQALFGVLDLGLSATVNREMARLNADGDRSRQRDVLRTLETVYWAGSASIGVILFLLAPLIATRWVTAQHVPASSITTAIRLMGIVISMQLPWGFYQGALMGLERQVFINSALLVTGTLRGAGAAFVLWRISPTIEAFFLWQAIVSVAQTAWIASSVWRSIPGEPARFVAEYLRAVWLFAATVAANAMIGVVLTQLDKVLLSRLLPLEQFGYYTLAGSIASVGWMVIIPINQALFPRFAYLLQIDDFRSLTTLYHRACQTLAVVIVPMTATIVLFAWGLIATWTGNSVAADHTALIVQLLIIGTTLNGLASLAVQLQTAAGWPQLIMFTNLASAVLLVPAVILAASRFGSVGAASVWVALNSAYLFVTVPIMHTRLLRGELGRWSRQDVLVPMAAAIGAAGAVRLLVPVSTSGLPVIAAAAAAWLFASVVAIGVSPLVRGALIHAIAEHRWPPVLWSRT